MEAQQLMGAMTYQLRQYFGWENPSDYDWDTNIYAAFWFHGI